MSLDGFYWYVSSQLVYNIVKSCVFVLWSDGERLIKLCAVTWLDYYLTSSSLCEYFSNTVLVGTDWLIDS